MIMTVSIPWPLVKFNFQLAVDLQIHREPLTLVRGARECYHLPKVNSQTSGGKEASYFSILDWLQAESNRFPKPNCSLYYTKMFLKWASVPNDFRCRIPCSMQLYHQAEVIRSHIRQPIFNQLISAVYCKKFHISIHRNCKDVPFRRQFCVTDGIGRKISLEEPLTTLLIRKLKKFNQIRSYQYDESVRTKQFRRCTMAS
jgi:hypothetical protein